MDVPYAKRECSSNPQRVARLPPREYSNINMYQLLQKHFETRPASVKRQMRACISQHEKDTLTPFGCTVGTLNIATTVATKIPPSVLAHVQGIDVDFDRLCF
jgi:hypothetical protein